MVSTCSIRQSQRSGELRRCGQIGTEYALVVVFFGARHLQRLAHAQIQGQVRLDMPIVLNERGARCSSGSNTALPHCA